MLPILRPPKLLPGFLNQKVYGRNPSELLEEVRPTVSLDPFYLYGGALGQILDYYVSPAAGVATGPHVINTPNAVVPDNTWRWVRNFGVRIDNTAGSSGSLNLAIMSSFAGGSTPTPVAVATAVDASLSLNPTWTDLSYCFPQHRLWQLKLLPGDTFAWLINQTTTQVTTWHFRIQFYDFPI